ncbi:MAG TPA: hypothetical protein PKV98_16280 [Burkholderiaceae bacterium]|nr:hypothetical protein [Burkholderiaceae bacterium]
MNFTAPPPDEALLRATWHAIRPARCALSLAEALRHPTWCRVIDMAAKSASGYIRPHPTPAPQPVTEPDLFTEAP